MYMHRWFFLLGSKSKSYFFYSFETVEQKSFKLQIETMCKFETLLYFLMAGNLEYVVGILNIESTVFCY